LQTPENPTGLAHKAGFVNIIGNPNVGKSTLMNNLVGERISIITSKAQTTRHRIMGIVSGEDFQIVYSDTPGILDPRYKLQEGMMRFVHSALADADILIVVTDVFEIEVAHPAIMEKVLKMGLPVAVLLNKIDQAEQDVVIAKIESLKEKYPTARVAPVSALHGFNTPELLDYIIEKLPESPAYFPKDELTDKSMRFFVSEIVREKILKHYKQEIPYSCEVIVREYQDTEKIVKISTEIMVARDSQKSILIGHKGLAMKRVGTEARRDIEAFVGKKVFIELLVKVDKNWRDDTKKLKRYGYLSE
jgi:GTP-binding protein Era